jgi:hypothetical protein
VAQIRGTDNRATCCGPEINSTTVKSCGLPPRGDAPAELERPAEREAFRDITKQLNATIKPDLEATKASGTWEERCEGNQTARDGDRGPHAGGGNRLRRERVRLEPGQAARAASSPRPVPRRLRRPLDQVRLESHRPPSARTRTGARGPVGRRAPALHRLRAPAGPARRGSARSGPVQRLRAAVGRGLARHVDPLRAGSRDGQTVDASLFRIGRGLRRRAQRGSGLAISFEPPAETAARTEILPDSGRRLRARRHDRDGGGLAAGRAARATARGPGRARPSARGSAGQRQLIPGSDRCPAGDGVFAPKDFLLENPPRLVIDLPASEQVRHRVIAGQSALVTRVRCPSSSLFRTR